MKHTYSHYEKVVIPLNRNWFQKLMRMPEEASMWQRRSWTGSEEELKNFSKTYWRMKVDSSEVYLWGQKLERNMFKTPYIKTTTKKTG